MARSDIDLRALDHLVEIARYHGVQIDRQRLIHDYSISEAALSEMRFLRIAQDLKLDVAAKRLSWQKLRGLGHAYPALLALKSGETFLASGFEVDPETGQEALLVVRKDAATNQYLHEPVLLSDLKDGWSGTVYLFRPARADPDEDGTFNLGWFVREAARQKRIFAEIIVIALMIHVTALAVPLFFQITVDKVLVHESFQTLNVLAVAVVIILLFQGVFNFLRDYLLAFATSKIDMRTATRTFGHLVRLPLSFFHRATAGVLTKHMQQTDEIRQFLTGNVLETLLDSTALLVFLPLLFLYSWQLGLVVLGFSVLIALVIAGMLRPLYSALTRLYAAEGERQSLLVESIHGISTIKSLALEPRRNRVWDTSSAQSVRTHFRVNKLGTIAESTVETLEQLMAVAVLFLGAHMVFQGELTVGKLIAFNMLSGYVSQPLIKIVRMIHEYQRARLAVKMLGTIMNARPETGSQSQAATPQITGEIRFEDVRFFYDGAERPALTDVSFRIREGEVIGIVGESGSGKSTLARLVQGLYAPNDGRIVLNGTDIREIDLAHLRQSVGIVLQENFLFRGSVRENIALTHASASLEDVKRAARLAGAAGFVEEMPAGYDTMLEENATNLSGGQRQRLAIARALLRDPRLLIFDEATSALDVESETIIQDNLAQIADGRTMLIIAHRLSTLHMAERIMVMNKGRIEAFASREALLDTGGPDFSPTFQRMCDIQMRNAMGVVDA
ncbi:peptidase domain-containing ABC transporter [Roseobacter sinensis]|uniref:Peptidase domain-containing ABC transporter n=1 Tax=Roseobacter sinensis TaxID=2931391 RepID=A0ABT3BKN1_9RHOB|nr:peptidase domain-containing ABC transporter [Roseobacter sp. WL0113]MCV3273659.1 peptidase domain-containing ABC transporter [Roseobacter sp. WL0113]